VVFPDHLKISIVKALFMRDDKTSMTNYRPVSVLTVFSKVLKKFIYVYNRLSDRRNTNNIIVPKQFSSRQGKSTDNSAFNLTNSLLKSINKKMHVGEIFCDLAKELDCVYHEILLSKLHYGIQATVANWFRC
jgi:hypothetical protein